jgi:hypothetical protein
VTSRGESLSKRRAIRSESTCSDVKGYKEGAKDGMILQINFNGILNGDQREDSFHAGTVSCSNSICGRKRERKREK